MVLVTDVGRQSDSHLTGAHCSPRVYSLTNTIGAGGNGGLRIRSIFEPNLGKSWLVLNYWSQGAKKGFQERLGFPGRLYSRGAHCPLCPAY